MKANSAGRTGPRSTISHVVIGKTTPPSNVASISYTPEQFGVRLTWPAVADLDVAEYELRCGGTSWETSLPLDGGTTRIRSTSYEWRLQAAGSRTVYVKAVDATGNYSAAAASTSVVIAPPVFSRAYAVDVDELITADAKRVAETILDLFPKGTDKEQLRKFIDGLPQQLAVARANLPEKQGYGAEPKRRFQALKNAAASTVKAVKALNERERGRVDTFACGSVLEPLWELLAVVDESVDECIKEASFEKGKTAGTWFAKAFATAMIWHYWDCFDTAPPKSEWFTRVVSELASLLGIKCGRAVVNKRIAEECESRKAFGSG